MTEGGRACQECGEQLGPGAAFCRNCGARYTEPEPEPVLTCLQCGAELTPSAAFCRSCGTPVDEPALPFEGPTEVVDPPPPPPPLPLLPDPPPSGGGRSRRRVLLIVAALVLVVGAGVAIALLVTQKSHHTVTTTIDLGTSPRPGSEEEAEGEVTEPEEEPTEAIEEPIEEAEPEERPVEVPESSPGTIEAGSYMEAGTFKSVADAEEEQSRLAADGIEVEVVPSEEAQELYPGFQVLLGGPFLSASTEKALLRKLHHDGVPSALVRALTPASSAAPSELGGGTWTGRLEESSTSKPRLDRSLQATFTASADGGEAKLTITAPHCVAELRAEPPTGAGLRFSRDSGCFAGTWRVRPNEGGLMVSLLPANSDLIVLGELH